MKRLILPRPVIRRLLLSGALLAALCACKPAAVSPAATSTPGTDVFVPVVFATASPDPSLPAASAAPTTVPDALTAQGSAYTIAWMSDTQYYSRQDNGVFECMTQFLADNAERMQLKYIVHTGDLVHNWDQEQQWVVADRAMRAIDAIPNGVLAGNHDVGTDAATYSYETFSKWFGQSRYQGKPWYGGSYLDNRGHYDLIDAGNTQYVFVYLGYHITPEGMDWANGVFRQYPDRAGVLCAHDYFYHDLTLTEQGQMLYDGVVSKNPNLYMVLCGHRYNSACIPASFDDDGDGNFERTVLQMIANYQAVGDAAAEVRTGGDGYMRFLQVDEDAGLIRYYSYSPYTNDYTYFDDAKHQTENYAFDPAGEQAVVAIPWTY